MKKAIAVLALTGITIVWDDGGQPASIPFGMFMTDVAAATPATNSFALWYKGSQVGEIESNGRVWKDGSIIGE